MKDHPTNGVGVVGCGRGHRAKEHPTQSLPTGEPGPLERSHGASLGVPAQGPLGHEGRNTDEEGEDQIEENEGGASEPPHHIREPPDIPQAYGHTHHGGQEAEAGGEGLSAHRWPLKPSTLRWRTGARQRPLHCCRSGWKPGFRQFRRYTVGPGRSSGRSASRSA